MSLTDSAGLTRIRRELLRGRSAAGIKRGKVQEGGRRPAARRGAGICNILAAFRFLAPPEGIRLTS